MGDTIFPQFTLAHLSPTILVPQPVTQQLGHERYILPLNVTEH